MIIGFMHIYAVNDYKKIVEDQVRRIYDSGLIQHVSRIYYCVVGPEPYIIEESKYCLLDCSNNMSDHEIFTLHHIHKIAKNTEKNFKLFYIHTKGVTRPEEKALQDWRELMEYFCLNQWQYALEALDVGDTAGINIRYYGKVAKRFHYSGNFWWANSHYIKTLPHLSKEGYGREVNRWDGEFWIGDGNGRMVSLWESRQHHGSRQYGPSNYEGKSPQMRYYGRPKNGS